MAEVIKRLGATTVVANTDTALYVCPANTMAAISCINVCNTTIYSGVSFRLAHVDGAIATVALEDYIAYDETLPAGSNIAFQIGVAMEAAESLLVRSGSTYCVFQCWGSEVS